MKLAFFKRDVLKRNIPKRPATVIALGLVTAASIVIGREKPALEVVESRPARAKNTAAAPEIDLDKLKRIAAADAPQNDPFAPRSFAPAPRARAGASAAAAPAPRTAPRLPFTYAGWVSQDGKTEVYVQRGEELISIAAGQKIEPDYRVDSITDSSIGFTYLPMKTHQALARVEPEGGRPGSEPAKARRESDPAVGTRESDPAVGTRETDPAVGRPG